MQNQRKFKICVFSSNRWQLAEDILSRLPQPSGDAIKSGISSMICMVASPYDDVALKGCASVAKLAAASRTTRVNIAAANSLLGALLNVIAGNLSIETRTAAAAALAELTQEETAQRYLAALAGDVATVAAILSLFEVCNPTATAAAAIGAEEYEILCLQTYW